VQNGEVGTEAARERHGAIAGMARGLGEIDRTEDVLDVDHGYLQSGRGADAGDRTSGSQKATAVPKRGA
jgi:hypothetical protein